MGYDRDKTGRWLCTACGHVRGTHAPGCSAAAVEANIQRRAWGRFPWAARPDEPPQPAADRVTPTPRPSPSKRPGVAAPLPVEQSERGN